MGVTVKLATAGLEEIRRAMLRIETIPMDVQADMVDAKAKITEEAQIYRAATMLQGPYYTGDTAASVKRTKPRKLKSGPVSWIRFEGMQHGNRNAEVAFVNEYGKTSQPARPFIRRANAESEREATLAAAEVMFDWQKKQGL